MTANVGPALLQINGATRNVHSLDGIGTFLVGRNPTADLPIADATCSREQFRILGRQGQWFLEPLSVSNPTFCDGKQAVGVVAMADGAIILAGGAAFQFVGPGCPLPALTPKAQATVVGAVFSDEAPGVTEPVPLVGEMLLGRDPGRVQITLPHVQVSRVHARLTLRGTKAVLADLNSANGTYLNGRRLVLPAMVQPGDTIGIGPFTLTFTGESLAPSTRCNNAQLAGRNLRRVVPDRKTGGRLTILDDVSLVIRPREFVCLLGPSGSGKTTLLSVLSGRQPPEQGEVVLNQSDLYANFESLKQDLVVVPQRDILHDRLTVEDALRYTSRLRLPPDTSRDEIERVVSETIRTVGLGERRSLVIRHLSGGQAKRASLANELLANPSLLFLDEVTSGLDEQSDREMMALFRQVAESGKTVVCVTHSLANVERNCHLVVILTPGGMLAFVGPPADAREYFQIERLGDVYERLGERTPEHWQEQFAESRHYARYVATRLPPRESPVHRSVARPSRGPLVSGWTALWHQFPVLTHRYLQVFLADRKAVAGLAAQCLWATALLVIVFGDIAGLSAQDPRKALWGGNLLFMMGVACLWFGCNNSAKEMVKERSIYAKERQVNLHAGAYYASKLVLQGGVAIVQTTLLFLLLAAICRPVVGGWPQWGLMLALALTGVTMGLLISSLSPSEDFAVTLVPMVLIPQIALAGVLKVLDGLPELASKGLVTLYWGYGGMRGLLQADLAAQLPAQPGSPEFCAGIVLAHAAIMVAAALAVLRHRDR